MKKKIKSNQITEILERDLRIQVHAVYSISFHFIRLQSSYQHQTLCKSMWPNVCAPLRKMIFSTTFIHVEIKYKAKPSGNRRQYFERSDERQLNII